MEPTYNLMLYGLNPDRQKLYERINARAEKMLQSGLIQEVQDLLNMGYSKTWYPCRDWDTRRLSPISGSGNAGGGN